MTAETVNPEADSAKSETPSERYPRQIRNVLVAAFVIWIVGGITAGIVYGVVIAHAHEAQAKARCENGGGIWVDGQCI